MTISCCSRPYRIPAPIDKLLPSGIRLRHLPGEVCLSCHSISIFEFDPSQSLLTSIASGLQRAASDLAVIKAITNEVTSGKQSCPHCSLPLESARLDIGFGQTAGLIVENLKGLWCWKCKTGVLSDEGKKLKKLLKSFSPNDHGSEIPSLLYDTPSHPRSVQFEITTRCNLKCPYCTHRLLSEKKDVVFDQFERIVANVDLDYVDNIDFTGLGEPTLNRQLHKMIKLIRKLSSPSDIRVVTNGTILSEERFKPLCDAGITSIAISIDSLDAGKFGRNRLGASLPAVLKNLESLVKYRDKNCLDNLNIKIKAVLTNDIYQEAEKLLSYSAKLGLEMPHFSCLDKRENANGNYEQNWLQSDLGENNSQVFTIWTKARWDQLGGVNCDSSSFSYPTYSDRKAGFIHPMLLSNANLCRWAIDAAFLSLDGGCLACCEQMIDVPRKVWGRVSDVPLRQLWNNELLWGYRLPLSVGQVPTECVGCSWAPAGGKPINITADRRSDRTIRSRLPLPTVEKSQG